MGLNPGLAGFLLAVGLVSGLAEAQSLKKYVMPDGHVIYSDKPIPGATLAKTIEAPPTPTAEQRAAAQKRAEEEKRKRDELQNRLAGRKKDLDSAEQRVAKARKGLTDAETALETGRAPLPGEMQGTAGGNVRPGEAYQKRIADLERNVEAARKEVDDALRNWNSMR